MYKRNLCVLVQGTVIKRLRDKPPLRVFYPPLFTHSPVFSTSSCIFFTYNIIMCIFLNKKNYRLHTTDLFGFLLEENFNYINFIIL